MDTRKYTNQHPFPQKSRFQTKYWYHHGAVVAIRPPGAEIQILKDTYTIDKVHDLTISETVVNEEAFRQAKQEYHAAEQKLLEDFKADLFKELGITDHPKRELLYAKAWNEGHAAGLQDVFNWAEDLVDLIKD